MENEELMDTAPWLRRKQKSKSKVKPKNTGPQIKIIIENWGGIKRQTWTGFPNSVNIDAECEKIYSLGDYMPKAISPNYVRLDINMTMCTMTNE